MVRLKILSRARPDASTMLSSKHPPAISTPCSISFHTGTPAQRNEAGDKSLGEGRVEGFSSSALEDILLTQSPLCSYWVPIEENRKWVKADEREEKKLD
jgi:hypothetical protein